MKTILNNLTKKTGGQINNCEVVRVISPNIYGVKDEMGRNLVAESSQSWRAGDYVSVKDNRIIGKSTGQTAITIIEV